MDSQQPDGIGSVSARQRTRQAFEDFPGPVAIAGLPPADTAFRWRGENMDGRPWALEAVYSQNGKPVLLVRTVRGSIDWQPAFETNETLRSTLAGNDPEDTLSGATEVDTRLDVDGISLAASRIDLPDRSGIHIEWQGQKLFCVGRTQLIDNLTLRTATSADLVDNG